MFSVGGGRLVVGCCLLNIMGLVIIGGIELLLGVSCKLCVVMCGWVIIWVMFRIGE